MNFPDLSTGSPYAKIDAYENGLWPYDPPTPIYKYMEERWAKEFLKSGAIQLSPTSTYNDLPNLGETRDENDGKQRTTMFDADLPMEHPHTFGNWETFAPGVIGDPKTGRLFMANSFESKSADCLYVLCTTPKWDYDLMKQLDPKYNCALQIEDPVGFFITIGRYLIRDGITKLPYFGKCSYNGKTTFIEKGSGRERLIPRALLKKKEHSHHEEIRMVFPCHRPPKDSIKPKITALKNYVKLVRF
jgi:hypothetical protein